MPPSVVTPSGRKVRLPTDAVILPAGSPEWRLDSEPRPRARPRREHAVHPPWSVPPEIREQGQAQDPEHRGLAHRPAAASRVAACTGAFLTEATGKKQARRENLPRPRGQCPRLPPYAGVWALGATEGPFSRQIAETQGGGPGPLGLGEGPFTRQRHSAGGSCPEAHTQPFWDGGQLVSLWGRGGEPQEAAWPQLGRRRAHTVLLHTL